MAELALNRFKIEINNFPKKLYFLKGNDLEGDEKHFLARYEPSNILNPKKIKNWEFLTEEIKNFIQGFKKDSIEDEEFIYISFTKDQNAKELDIEFQSLPFSLQKKFLKENFIRMLSNYYIIEPYKEGVDFSVYKKDNLNENRFIRYDFVFNAYKDKNNKLFHEVTISVGSTDSYILYIPRSKKEKISKSLDFESVKILQKPFLIRNESKNKNIFEYPVKANFEIRKILEISTSPKRKFYKDYYHLIQKFVFEISEILLKRGLILSTAFSQIPGIKTVTFEANKMVFGGNNVDFITINGMRDFGPYFVPEYIKKTKLLFIYPDSECANKLYNYFARGYKHFPGLESYVGIPANIFEKKIAYESNLESLPEKINNELTQESYSNLIAVCIMPFSKSTAEKRDSKIYYKIKEQLLKKNIPTQFIHRGKIFEENFHFSLPNIAIAMLAKCGGIPWKLAKPHYNQLTIGFNIKSIKADESNKTAKTYLGSAVFFDNEGIIRDVNGFNKSNLNNICKALQEAINKYKNNSNEVINKIVVHFYKSISNEEFKKIKKVIKLTLSKNSIFAIVEINDTKTSIDLGFDLSYVSYMPQSGTYIKLKPNEYLLFNNLRYWERPINPINQEELPIKLRIYDPFNSFDHHELISQVYEFSRMYWKSLKQKAQPVTITYSKLIAEYMSEFEEGIPDNEVAKKRVWFI